MIAAMGYITPEITGKLPDYLSPSADLRFADVLNGLRATSAATERATRQPSAGVRSSPT